MTVDGHPTDAAPLWHNRDFMLLWSGQLISGVGSGVSEIVVPLLILALTNSPTAAGIATALRTVPYVIFSVPVGALIDRWNRKKVMMLCDTGRAITLASIPLAIGLGVLTVWQLYIAAFIEGTLYVFFNIAEVAALPRVVSKAQLPAATAQNQVAYGVAGIIGPGLGTFIYQALGHALPFLLDAVSYTVSVLSFFFIRTEFQAERATTARNLRSEIGEGLSWLWRQPLILFMAFLTGGLHFMSAANTLIIIVLSKQLNAGESQIGLIFSIAAIGGIIGSIIGGPVAKRFSFGQMIVTIVWLNAILFSFYAVASNLWLVGIVTVLIYLVSPTYDIVQFSYRVALIPDRLQGRVNSVWRLIAFGFGPLGAVTCGVLLERVGVVPTVVVCAVWSMALGILATANKYVRHARPIEEVSPT